MLDHTNMAMNTDRPLMDASFNENVKNSLVADIRQMDDDILLRPWRNRVVRNDMIQRAKIREEIERRRANSIVDDELESRISEIEQKLQSLND